MKKLFTILTAVLITATVWAQSPEKMTYQSVIRNASDQLVTNQDMGMQISILQSSASGTAVYVETHSTTSNANGLVTIEIGNGTLISGDFSIIDWANGPYFLKTETDPTTAGGTNYTITGTSQLLSVPYSLYAKTAGTADYNNLTNLPALNITNWDNAYNWGDHSTAGYLSDYTETDPIFTAWDKDYADLTGKPTAISDFTMNADAQNITNLADPVNDQDAATKAYVDELRSMILDLQADAGVDDIDGNHYEAVVIGNQIWMAEDLRVTHYPNGEPIPNVTDNTAWENLADNNTDDAYCFYDNNSGTDYGALYTYAASIGDDWARDNIDGQGVCPDGWHLPTDAEWTTLTDELGGESVAGGKLKETGTTHWNSPNSGATNESGFTALPGGCRGYNTGYFYYLGSYGYFWPATEYTATFAWDRGLYYNISNVSRDSINKSFGLSVRCLRD